MTDKDDYIISLKPLKFEWRNNSETDQLDIPYGYRIVTDEECWFYSVIIINAPYTQMGDACDEEFLSRHPTREEAEDAANKHFHDCITGWIKSIERKPTASGDSLKGGA